MAMMEQTWQYTCSQKNPENPHRVIVPSDTFLLLPVLNRVVLRYQSAWAWLL